LGGDQPGGGSGGRLYHCHPHPAVCSFACLGTGQCGGHAGGLPSAEFTITADYEIFARISRAELKARAALMSGKMKLKGPLVKALRLAPLVDRLNEVIATIPTDY